MAVSVHGNVEKPGLSAAVCDTTLSASGFNKLRINLAVIGSLSASFLSCLHIQIRYHHINLMAEALLRASRILAVP